MSALSFEINKHRVYGRRQGRPLHGGRQKALDTMMPMIGIQNLPEDGTLHPNDLFDILITGKVHFEIGFGNGEHLLHLLKQNPDDVVIGAEPFINGMSAFAKALESYPEYTSRVRVLMDDALKISNSLQGNSIDYLYILNPDPWPKARHHKRRMISQENLNIFARVMKQGAEMLQTTDVDELAEWMVRETHDHGTFEWIAESKQDWLTPPTGWDATRYEIKGKLAGRTQVYLHYIRR
jgi:tRNA (guanine-N7-)-methyltransferase